MDERKVCTVCCERPRHKAYAKCYECYNDYLRRYMAKRYAERRALAFELLGGACEDCGSTDLEDLDVDHVIAKDKVAIFTRMVNYGMERFRAELSKCALRCHSCHVEKSKRAGDWKTVEHGGGKAGKHGCPCDLCKGKRNEYNRDRKRRIRRSRQGQ